jgi:hypothetical protein
MSLNSVNHIVIILLLFSMTMIFPCAGETAVKRDSRAREVEEQEDHGAPITNRPPSKDVIDSFVQYRRFVLELASRRVERQQYVLELALALRDVAPKVHADGTKVTPHTILNPLSR